MREIETWVVDVDIPLRRAIAQLDCNLMLWEDVRCLLPCPLLTMAVRHTSTVKRNIPPLKAVYAPTRAMLMVLEPFAIPRLLRSRRFAGSNRPGRALPIQLGLQSSPIDIWATRCGNQSDGSWLLAFMALGLCLRNFKPSCCFSPRLCHVLSRLETLPDTEGVGDFLGKSFTISGKGRDKSKMGKLFSFHDGP